MNPRADELIIRYLDESASADERDELASLAESDQAVLSALIDAVRLHRELAVLGLRGRGADEEAEEQLRYFIRALGEEGKFSEELWRRAGQSVSPRRSVRRAGARPRAAWHAWLSVAACLAIIAGALVYNEYRARKSSELFIAHVVSTVPGARIVRAGREIGVVVDLRILSGDRVITGRGQTVRFSYENEDTHIGVREDTVLDIGGTDRGKTLRLETGVVDAVVAPQPADRPMVLTTPQAKAQVKGTALSLSCADSATRLEVREGLVALTRLSDMKTIDVAAGQYATVAEGVELAAAALVAAPVRPAVALPAGNVRYVDGAIVFQDDFERGTAAWTKIMGTIEAADGKPLGREGTVLRVPKPGKEPTPKFSIVLPGEGVPQAAPFVVEYDIYWNTDQVEKQWVCWLLPLNQRFPSRQWVHLRIERMPRGAMVTTRLGDAVIGRIQYASGNAAVSEVPFRFRGQNEVFIDNFTVRTLVPAETENGR